MQIFSFIDNIFSIFCCFPNFYVCVLSLTCVYYIFSIKCRVFAPQIWTKARAFYHFLCITTLHFTLYYTFLKHDWTLYSKFLRCFCFNLVFKKKRKLFQHILNCVKWVAIEFISHNLFSCNLKLYIQTVIYP